MYKRFSSVLIAFCILSLSGILSLFEPPAPVLAAGQVNVIIVGAGTGGIGAAIQAARSGSSVLLLEETDWVGGQMTSAAVSTMDGGDWSWTAGIYKEFVDNVRNHYLQKGKTLNTCYFSDGSVCFEPSVGQSILLQMLATEPNITLRLRTKVIEVYKSGSSISGIVVETGGTSTVLSANVYIDATEYGDFLKLSGASYRVGNSTGTSPNPDAPIQDITYPAVIKKYPNGVPADLKINTPPPGYSAQVEAEFAQIVTKNGQNSWTGALPVNFSVHNWYRGNPDSSNPANYSSANFRDITKTEINWANDYSVTTRYLEDVNYRKTVNCEAKLKTIHFIYYIQNTLGENNWSVANDEGFDTPYNREMNGCPNIPTSLKAIERNMPLMPYVRESRRAIGPFTLTGPAIKRVGYPPKAAQTFTNSVAVGDYPVDIHGCREYYCLETDLESPADIPPGFVSGPFQVPMSVFFSVNVDNLVLAEKNLSQTRIANGATRLQPITMLTGQAAGAIAAYAAQHLILPNQVNIREIQRILTESGSFIVPYIDMSAQDVTFSYTQQMAARGIMVGYGNLNFGSEDLLKRSQIAVILSKAFNIPAYRPVTPTFIDVPGSDMFYPYIEGLTNAKIIYGCSVSPRKFCPNGFVTNAEIAVMVMQTARQYNPAFNPVAQNQTYSDVTPNHWAYKHIEGLAELGIKWYCDPIGKKFCPDSPSPRKFISVPIIKSLNILGW